MSNKRIETDGDQFLTLAETARFLDKTEAAVRTLVAIGKAPPYVKLNGWFLRFPMSGLIEYKRQRQKLTAPEPRRVSQ